MKGSVTQISYSKNFSDPWSIIGVGDTVGESCLHTSAWLSPFVSTSLLKAAHEGMARGQQPRGTAKKSTTCQGLAQFTFFFFFLFRMCWPLLLLLVRSTRSGHSFCSLLFIIKFFFAWIKWQPRWVLNSDPYVHPLYGMDTIWHGRNLRCHTVVASLNWGVKQHACAHWPGAVSHN